jgi:hypothetical protein
MFKFRHCQRIFRKPVYIVAKKDGFVFGWTNKIFDGLENILPGLEPAQQPCVCSCCKIHFLGQWALQSEHLLEFLRGLNMFGPVHFLDIDQFPLDSRQLINTVHGHERPIGMTLLD